METITNLIQNGLLKDLIISERSYLLNKKISETSKGALRKTNKIEISKILYNLTYTEMVLAMGRLYDNPDKKYPTRCIKQLYKIVKELEYKIEIKDKAILFTQLRHLDLYPDMINLLDGSSIVDFNKRAIAFFEAEELNDPIMSCIRTIKDIRNKFLAHNEDIKLTSFLPYDSIEFLLNHAKNVISFFSLAYSGIILKSFDDFFLTYRALNWTAVYNKFMKE